MTTRRKKGINSKPNPRLTQKQLKALSETPASAFARVFPLHSQRFLARARREYLAGRPAAEGVDAQVTLRAHRAEGRTMAREYREALAVIEKLRKDLTAVARLQAEAGARPVEIKARRMKRREATAVVLASDWHCEEIIKPENINHMNEHSPAIFKRRAKAFFANVAELLQKERGAIEINTMILHLGGDFISGSIHEELAESNAVQPVEAMITAQETIKAGIAFLLKECPDLSIVVPCSSGNHGRTTQKRRIKTEQGYSLEYFAYFNLAAHFKDDRRVRFVLSPAYHIYVPVYGRVIRFHHGHNIKYGGGVGGITIPINKAIAGWNKAKHADLDCFGHFHQFFASRQFVCNGSLIGYSEYAVSIKADYEPPQQAFFLFDSEHGRTVTAPILLAV